MRYAFRLGASVLIGFTAVFASAVLAQAVNTTSESNSSEIVPGSTPSVYVWVNTYIGPQTIQTGSQTGCTASSLPPAGCTLSGGSGTQASPLAFSCSGIPPLTGCSGGSALSIVAGGEDINTFVFTVSPTAQPGTAGPAAPVPLNPWIPLLTGLAVLLCLLGIQRRGRG